MLKSPATTTGRCSRAAASAMLRTKVLLIREGRRVVERVEEVHQIQDEGCAGHVHTHAHEAGLRDTARRQLRDRVARQDPQLVVVDGEGEDPRRA